MTRRAFLFALPVVPAALRGQGTRIVAGDPHTKDAVYCSVVAALAEAPTYTPLQLSPGDLIIESVSGETIIRRCGPNGETISERVLPPRFRPLSSREAARTRAGWR